ncbi:MAG: hypothetical protein EB075_12885, partial [Bacteroidetes bacterium]|nr:hypothetical protein [Bacteroidota bacterium]
MLGQDQDSYGGGFQANQALRGDIAKLTIWDRVLEADEIREGPNTGDAVHHFAFDEGSGATIQDQRGGLQAQIIGDVTWKDETPLTSANVKLAGEVHNGILDVSDVSSSLSLDVAQLKDVTHVIGTDHNDTLTGDDKDNQLEGHDGDDTLTGHDGNDTLVGGLGADTKTGGEGADTFVYRTAEETTSDVITDFVSGEDKIDLSALGPLVFSERGPRANALWTVKEGNDLRLLGDTNGTPATPNINLLL